MIVKTERILANGLMSMFSIDETTFCRNNLDLKSSRRAIEN